MKKPVITALLSCFAVAAYAQGTVALNNAFNSPSAPSTATSGGLFFLYQISSGPHLIMTDFNAVFMMGPASGPTTTVSIIGNAAAGDNLFGPGTFFDLSGNNYAIPGVPNGSCTMTIQAWLGSAPSYASAPFDVKGSATFLQRVSDSTASPPQPGPSLVDMPSIILGFIPEPSTFALAGMGAAALFIFRRRK